MKSPFAPAAPTMKRLFSKFRRLTALEAAVVGRIATLLEGEERAAWEHQVRMVRIERDSVGRSVRFTYSRSSQVPALERFGSGNDFPLAVFAVKGTRSGFKANVTVRISAGVLSSLVFDIIPWDPSNEPIEILGHIANPPTK